MSSSSSQQKNLFLVGPGLIGGSLLVKLKEARPDLKLHALTRRKEQADSLSSLGITPIQGSLEDHDLIAEWAAKSDIVIHAASADDDKGSFAILDGLTSRPKDAPRVVYIQTSGNDELAVSARGYAGKSIEEKTLSDVKQDDAALLERIHPQAYHRHVDGPLLERLLNPAKEKEHNVVGSIMMPPLIYGIGSEPWKRISIQTPMLTQAMIDRGTVALPEEGEEEGKTGHWNGVWVHDLVDAYVILLSHLEGLQPGEQKTHIVFPAEKKPFVWREHFAAVASELKRLGHPSAQGEPRLLKTRDEFYDFIGGKENPYSDCFSFLVWGKENSFTSPDLLSSLGFKHKAKGVVDSILNGKELEGFINERLNK